MISQCYLGGSFLINRWGEVMTKADERLKGNIREILDNGATDENPRAKYRDGTPAHTVYISDVYEKYGIGEVPITTLRNIPIKHGFGEILWIYQQASNRLADLHDMGITYWDDWDIGDGTIGERYGKTVENYDLTNKLLTGLKEDPFSRRHIMSLWQEEDLKKSGLHPCAFLTEWVVMKRNGELYLDLMLIQRSNDYLVSGHINMVQYKALQLAFAKHLGYKAGTFSRHVANMHIYDRHIEQAHELLKREGSEEEPELILDVPDGTSFWDIKPTDLKIKNYHPNKPQLKFDLGI